MLNNHVQQVDDIDLHIVNSDYGKGFMKKCRISPDGYIQVHSGFNKLQFRAKLHYCSKRNKNAVAKNGAVVLYLCGEFF